jgi:hypothetical protein
MSNTGITLGELGERDFDNFQHIMKNARVQEFESSGDALLAHTQRLQECLVKHGVVLNMQSEPQQIEDVMKAKSIRVEARQYPDVEYDEVMVQKYLQRDKDKPFINPPLGLTEKHNKEQLGKYTSGMYVYKGNTEEIYKANEIVGFVSFPYSSPLTISPQWFVRWVIV